mmetsp:Transcript_21042/g.64288  ORF Transcript_21042/g.64288 Transcript_21042/m.64288 type:complete len:200 (+) Transcript_21042:734-1333(+)
MDPAMAPVPLTAADVRPSALSPRQPSTMLVAVVTASPTLASDKEAVTGGDDSKNTSPITSFLSPKLRPHSMSSPDAHISLRWSPAPLEEPPLPGPSKAGLKTVVPVRLPEAPSRFESISDLMMYSPRGEMPPSPMAPGWQGSQRRGTDRLDQPLSPARPSWMPPPATKPPSLPLAAPSDVKAQSSRSKATISSVVSTSS